MNIINMNALGSKIGTPKFQDQSYASLHSTFTHQL